MPQIDHYSIVVIDIESSSSLRNDEKVVVREALYRILREALEGCGISWDQATVEDRGDGVYLLLPANAKRTLAGKLIDRVDAALGDRRVGDPPIRLRLALHCGDVCRDDFGSSGGEADHVFGLVDNDALKRKLRDSPRARMIVVVSDSFYTTVFRQYSDLDPTWLQFARLATKSGTVRAHVGVPGMRDLTYVEPEDEAETESRSAQPSGPVVNLGGVTMTGDGSVFQGTGRDIVTGGFVTNDGGG